MNFFSKSSASASTGVPAAAFLNSASAKPMRSLSLPRSRMAHRPDLRARACGVVTRGSGSESVSVGRDHLAAPDGSEGLPDTLGDRGLGETNRAVREHDIRPARVAAAGRDDAGLVWAVDVALSAVAVVERAPSIGGEEVVVHRHVPARVDRGTNV